jgi:carbonic anhydrase
MGIFHRRSHSVLYLAGSALIIVILSATLLYGPSTPAKAASARGEDAEPTAAQLWQELTEGNRRFMRGALSPKQVIGRREQLASGQHPKVAVLGCADSRVAPEIVFDRNLGDLFVVRTAGNITDPIALGSLEYAVEHLHVHTLVVLGHEKCGAVAAAASGQPMPTPGLSAIVNKIAPSLKNAAAATDAGDFSLNQVVANVHASADSVVRESAILQRAVDAHELTVLKGVYKLASGEVQRLK